MSRDFHVDRPFLWAMVHVPTKAPSCSAGRTTRPP